jgi:hypothetical protein
MRPGNKTTGFLPMWWQPSIMLCSAGVSGIEPG